MTDPLEIKTETAVLCKACKEYTETDDPNSECDWCFSTRTEPVMLSTCPSSDPATCREPGHSRSLNAHVKRVSSF